MIVYRLSSLEEFTQFFSRNYAAHTRHEEFIASLLPDDRSEFSTKGYSYSAGCVVDFQVDFTHALENGPPNWRESVICPVTQLNNRMRATIHLFETELQPYDDSKIYITEQTTPIYQFLGHRYPQLVGSEYLGDLIAFGDQDSRGLRNEDLCALSFPNDSFEIIVSLDVLEHIPDYQAAFRECARVLQPGGRILWSVPFAANCQDNIVRARMVDGEIEHLLPPEYHGDPVSAAGILCFTHFGWEMLDQMKAAGFKDAYAVFVQSIEFGYLGGYQILFVATK